jgi:hypothetical protein
MNKTLIISALSIFLILIIIPLTANAQDLDAINHEITITTQDNKNLLIKESIIFQLNTNESIYTIDFWIQDYANNVIIQVNNIEYSFINNENKYSINISNLDIKIGNQIIAEIAYILDKNTQSFEKKLFQNTDSITVTYDGKMLYSGLNNVNESQLTIPFYKIVETQKESPSIYYIIIVILIILIIIIFFYSLRLRKTPKTKEIISTTEEILTTKKSLLMSLLKDLEKQYRAKEISDDTYYKLKEHYKQETVETMKKIDDMNKSKI